MSKTVLVTGASGFVGRELCAELARRLGELQKIHGLPDVAGRMELVALHDIPFLLGRCEDDNRDRSCSFIGL